MPASPSSKAAVVATDVDALFAGIMSGERVSAPALTNRTELAPRPVVWVSCDRCGVEQVAIATFRGDNDYRNDFANPSAVVEIVRRTRQETGKRSVNLCDLCLLAVTDWAQPEPLQGRLEGF